MNKVFLYDEESVSVNTLTIMKRKGYVCIKLTNEPEFFWAQMMALGEDDVLVLLTHGDKNGPLAVAGTKGDDIDLKKFGELVKKKRLKLYLLSCHTGDDPCAATLNDLTIDFVAPKGNAVFETTGTDTVTVKSMDGDDYPGWAGSDDLKPGRDKKALSLP